MLVECSDFSVATYSVVSSSGLASAGASVTGVGGICGGAPASCCRLHALSTHATSTAAAAAVFRSDMATWTLGKKRGSRKIRPSVYHRPTIKPVIHLRYCNQDQRGFRPNPLFFSHFGADPKL